jgi:hypothetical protein
MLHNFRIGILVLQPGVQEAACGFNYPYTERMFRSSFCGALRSNPKRLIVEFKFADDCAAAHDRQFRAVA